MSAELFPALPDLFASVLATSRPICLTDASSEHRIVFANPAFTDLTGYTVEEVKGQTCHFLQGADTEPELARTIDDAMAAGQPVRCEILNYRKDGLAFWNDLTIDPIRDAKGLLTGYIVTHFDCTDARETRMRRAQAEQQLTSIVDSLPGYVFRRIMGPSYDVGYSYVSPSLYRILGLPADTEWAPAEFMEHVHRDDHSLLMRATMLSAERLTKLEVELRLVSPSGGVHWFRSVSSPVRRCGGDIVWDGVAIDITAEKSAEQRLAYLTHHDALTGLSNRSGFNAALVAALSNLSGDDRQTGIFYIDLDGFHVVNETMGEIFGNKALNAIGLRLHAFVASNSGTVARLGGDEFGVLLPNLASSSSGLETAEALCLLLRHPVIIDGEQAIIEGCVGAAVFPRMSDSSQVAAGEEWATELVKRATLAMEAAKRDGAGTCRLYVPELDDRLRDRPLLRKSLQQAIAEEQFTLHYQPVVDLAHGGIVGAEALLRWNHPELGLQRPDLFIPLAEESGLIVPLGAWVIKSVMQQVQAWNGKGLPRLLLGINLSSIQLQRPGFVAGVEQALTETGADPRQFEFELTEGTLIEATDAVNAQLVALKDRGFSLAIDDFGTGHATFKYLRDFSVDKIKIDQTFVRNLKAGSSDASIVHSMVHLSHSLGLTVVAEGIETAEQRDFLTSEGCAVGQGYFYSMPLSAEDFEWVLLQGCPLPMSAERPS
ncbi:MAG: sensor domain-containing protein [Janthinobacterium lividum]